MRAWWVGLERVEQRDRDRHRLLAGRARRAPDPQRRPATSAGTTVERRNSKCCGSRKKLRVVGRDRVEQRRQLGAARVGLDVRQVVAEAREAAGAQPLLQTREDQRPLAAVQRDAGALVDEPDDACELGVGEARPRPARERVSAHRRL